MAIKLEIDRISQMAHIRMKETKRNIAKKLTNFIQIIRLSVVVKKEWKYWWNLNGTIGFIRKFRNDLTIFCGAHELHCKDVIFSENSGFNYDNMEPRHCFINQYLNE